MAHELFETSEFFCKALDTGPFYKMSDDEERFRTETSPIQNYTVDLHLGVITF